MLKTDREQQSQRMFYALILVLVLGYGAIKFCHIMLAIEAHRGQVLDVDTSGAAK